MYIIDIGANRGFFTDKCISLFDNNLKMLVIEANPQLSELLVNKYIDNKNITVLNTLMSEINDKEVDFYLCDSDIISTASLDWINNSRFSNKGSIWYEPLKIKSTSLDYLINIYGEADVIKIDVEGYELEVLKGLTKKTKEICFEWAEEQYDNINEIAKHLESLGYNEFGYILGDEYMKRPSIYTTWIQSEFHNNINPNRKETWGMIWVK